MEVFRGIHTLRAELNRLRLTGNRIGLVPTMGCLHDGHLALIKQCKGENDITVCTIYVNPAQFNNKSDLDNYPRDLDADLSKLESSDCDIVFVPQDDEMYPGKPGIELNFGELESIMEGRFRPGHFKGVGLVVSKLFNIIQPDTAYFGKKDLQQWIVIRQLVRDLNFGIQIVGVDTIREDSGLAMSSRNERLTSEQRMAASIIYRALKKGVKKIKGGEDIQSGRQAVLEELALANDIKPEYVEFIDLSTNAILKDIPSRNIAVCTAAFLGEVRLIDNIIFETEES